jgi:hypothetical protein
MGSSPRPRTLADPNLAAHGFHRASAGHGNLAKSFLRSVGAIKNLTAAFANYSYVGFIIGPSISERFLVIHSEVVARHVTVFAYDTVFRTKIP